MVNPRIEENRALYEQLPPDVQRSVRAEQVRVGFDQKTVLLAWGEPTLRTTWQTPDGLVEIWVYRYRVVSSYSAARDSTEYRRLVFREGKVTSVEIRP